VSYRRARTARVDRGDPSPVSPLGRDALPDPEAGRERRAHPGGSPIGSAVDTPDRAAPHGTGYRPTNSEADRPTTTDDDAATWRSSPSFAVRARRWLSPRPLGALLEG